VPHNRPLCHLSGANGGRPAWAPAIVPDRPRGSIKSSTYVNPRFERFPPGILTLPSAATSQACFPAGPIRGGVVFKVRPKRAKSLVICGRGEGQMSGTSAPNLQGLRDFTSDSPGVTMASRRHPAHAVRAKVVRGRRKLMTIFQRGVCQLCLRTRSHPHRLQPPHMSSIAKRG
jgi:hypothetical protein